MKVKTMKVKKKKEVYKFHPTDNVRVAHRNNRVSRTAKKIPV